MNQQAHRQSRPWPRGFNPRRRANRRARACAWLQDFVKTFWPETADEADALLKATRLWPLNDVYVVTPCGAEVDCDSGSGLIQSIPLTTLTTTASSTLVAGLLLTKGCGYLFLLLLISWGAVVEEQVFHCCGLIILLVGSVCACTLVFLQHRQSDYELYYKNVTNEWDFVSVAVMVASLQCLILLLLVPLGVLGVVCADMTPLHVLKSILIQCALRTLWHLLPNEHHSLVLSVLGFFRLACLGACRGILWTDVLPILMCFLCVHM